MIKDRKITIKYIAIVAWSFVTMIAMAMVSGFGITGIDIVLPCLFALCIVVFVKVHKLFEDIHNLKYTIPLGVVVSIATVVGSKIDMDSRVFGAFGVLDIGYIVILIPFFVAVFELLFFSSDVISKKLNETGVILKKSNESGDISKKLDGSDIGCSKSVAEMAAVSKKNILINMAIMLICWLPYYLTYCPGGIGSDVFESVRMCLGSIPWTNHHPVFFTAIMKLYITIFAQDGNVTRALAMMVLCQMILLALVLSLSLAWLERRGMPKCLKIVALAFMALHPIFPMYAIYLTKDVLFAIVIVLLVLFLMDFVQKYMAESADENAVENEKNIAGSAEENAVENEKKIAGSAEESNRHKKNTNATHNKQTMGIGIYVVMGILFLLAAVTRNNGTLVILLTAIVMIVVMKKIRKQLLLVVVSVLILNGLYKGPIWSSIGIQKQSFVESAAIPLTQIAYTIYTDGIIEGEDRDYLESIMPFDKVKENFEPGYVDTYKFDKSFDASVVDADPGKLIKVWFHLLPKNFGRFVEGYLMETCGYWSYGVSNTLCTEGVVENDLGIVQLDFVKNLTGISLSGIIAKLMLLVRKLPVLCMLSQMAIETLAIVLVACQLIRRKKNMLVVAMVPLMAIWISVMIASPAYCLFRYMCPVFFLWPVLAYLFASERDNNEE